MVGLAVTYATVLLLTAPCSDDVLRWSPVAAADLAGYRITLNGSLIATASPLASTFPLGCVSGTVCVRARDLAGNESSAATSCMQWEADPGMFMDTSTRSCAVGCDRPRRDSRCCTAPISSEVP